MKYFFLFFCAIIYTSCNTELKSNYNQLKSENDSLKMILKELNNKYIFDSISFRDIYSKKNTKRLNSEFEIELLVVGYNFNQSFFTKYDSIDEKGRMVNPMKLKQINGGFKYKTILKSDENLINIEMDIRSKYGKSRSGKLHDKIIVK
ncbi:hypothetical protein [Tenacibaculum halocynthiae]|uniref:hypothetical protein n=1 Tax=Tenacibaculum halocynthiae TaxID=1254437 RepID=UPI003D65A6DB